MDAVEYFKTKKRMTKASEENIHCGLMCNVCPLSCQNNGTGVECSRFETLHPEKAVALVEKWSKEHPRKTFLSDFLEHFPKINYTIDELALLLCVKNMGYIDECPNIKNCKICWNTQMEE